MMQIVRALDEQFARLHERLVALVQAVPPGMLYQPPLAVSPPAAPTSPASIPHAASVGEHVLRGAAAVEQTFGGITVNLWDDPFEWTLPETLSVPEQVVEYLCEAEATRRRAFALFHTDADLTKEIATPSGQMRTLFEVVCDALVRAAHHEGRAHATFRLFHNARPPNL